MQCPKCGHEPSMKEAQESPHDCVKCGINYEGYARSRQPASGNAISAEVKTAMGRFPGAQPVVVIDVDMKFWSIVRLMVKWAIAAIPAFFILCLVAAFAGFVLREINSAFTKGPVSVKAEPSYSEYLDIKAEPEVAYFLVERASRSNGGFDVVLKRNAPEGVIFQRKNIDCASHKISLDAESSLYQSVDGAVKPGSKYSPSPGSVDDYLVGRLCK